MAETEQEKRCRLCGEIQPISEFYRHPAMSDGHLHHCKACHRANMAERYERVKDTSAEKAQRRVRARRNALKRLGITEAEYAARMADQGGVCAICGTTEPGRGSVFLPVDHCHDTGTVRGLLCHKCNLGIENFRDSPELLIAAAAYLLTQVDLIGAR